MQGISTMLSTMHADCVQSWREWLACAGRLVLWIKWCLATTYWQLLYISLTRSGSCRRSCWTAYSILSGWVEILVPEWCSRFYTNRAYKWERLMTQVKKMEAGWLHEVLLFKEASWVSNDSGGAKWKQYNRWCKHYALILWMCIYLCIAAFIDEM